MQVTHLADETTCIGFSLPHGIFDAPGMGHFFRCFEAELNGLPWEVPPVFPSNPLQAALDALEEGASGASEEAADDAMRYFPPGTEANVTEMLASFARELDEGAAERRTMWVGREVLEKLVGRVKEEVRRETEGTKFCSTGDILIAWFLKVNKLLAI